MPKLPRSRKLRSPKRRGFLSKLRQDDAAIQSVITDPNQLSKTLKRERTLTILSVLSLIVVALILLSLFVFGMWKLGVITLPRPIEILLGADPGQPDDTVTDDDSGLLSLITVQSEDISEAFELREDEYLSLIDSTVPISDYSVILEVTYSNGEGGSSSTKRHHIWRSGNKYRAETYDKESGQLLSIVISNGLRVSVTDHVNYDEPITRRFKTSDGFTLESAIGIPRVDDFLGRDDIENLVIKVIRGADANLYHVTFNYIGLTQVEELYISLDHRIILASDTTALVNGTAQNVYSLRASSLVEGKEAFAGGEDVLFKVAAESK